jgi:hypothetical protein
VRLASLSFAVLVASLPLAGHAQQKADSKVPRGFIKIDGRTEPHRIPQYVVWRTGLRYLATFLDQKDLNPLLDDPLLIVPAADRERVSIEAYAQRRRDDACWERQEARNDEMVKQGKSFPDLYDALLAIDMACRVEVIEARDRLLSKLTPEGQQALTAWIEEARAGISVYVPERELKTYWYPQ